MSSKVIAGYRRFPQARYFKEGEAEAMILARTSWDINWADEPPILTDGLHLMCRDTAKLHRFAREALGFKRSWFMNNKRHPHYDLTTHNARRRAVLAGACPIRAIDLVREVERWKERRTDV